MKIKVSFKSHCIVKAASFVFHSVAPASLRHLYLADVSDPWILASYWSHRTQQQHMEKSAFSHCVPRL